MQLLDPSFRASISPRRVRFHEIEAGLSFYLSFLALYHHPLYHFSTTLLDPTASPQKRKDKRYYFPRLARYLVRPYLHEHPQASTILRVLLYHQCLPRLRRVLIVAKDQTAMMDGAIRASS